MKNAAKIDHGGEASLVGRPGFKPGEWRHAPLGGFDSHSPPPFTAFGYCAGDCSKRLALSFANTFCIYNWRMEFTWSEAKRAANIKAHGLDFLDARSVFEGLTFTFEDDRFSYGEQRFVTLGMLAGILVSVVHTENEHEIRVISFRKATKRESQIYFDEIQD